MRLSEISAGSFCGHPEAFIRHPVVFRESAIGGKREPMPVSAFLRDARRLVVEFAVGRVLKADPDAEEDAAGLDDITTYYLLHRDTFGLIDAPVRPRAGERAGRLTRLVGGVLDPPGRCGVARER